MNVENAIRDYLLADATIGGLIGSRVYPEALPQSPVYPAITMIMQDVYELWTWDGPSKSSVLELQLDAWALSFDGAKALRDAITARINGFAGLIDAWQIHQVKAVSSFNTFESGVEAWRCSRLYEVAYWEV